jgi:hypothetical protein
MTRGPKPIGPPFNHRVSDFNRTSFLCPECNDARCVVIGTRENRDGTEIRRRRMCVNQHRFTTLERIDKGYPIYSDEPAEIISGVYA